MEAASKRHDSTKLKKYLTYRQTVIPPTNELAHLQWLTIVSKADCIWTLGLERLVPFTRAASELYAAQRRLSRTYLTE